GARSKNITTAYSATSLPLTSLTTTQLIFNVTTASAAGATPNTLTWQDVRVRPTAGTPLASGNITNSGSASLSGVPAGATFGFLQETAGAASKLVVLTFPPSTATAGAAFSPQPGIQIQDQFGNARTFNNGNSDTSTVVTAARNTGTSSVQGTVTATANNGVATFSNLSYNKAETITLVFTSGTLTSANSGNIIVSPAAASLLVFTTQPGSATYGSILGQQPVIKSQDAFGNNSTVGLPASKMVTLTLTGGSGTLSGTTSLDIGASASNGVVTFTNLQINAAGSGKQLTAAASGLNSAISAAFTVSPVTVTGSVTANNKVYDGGTSATIATRSLSGVLFSDDVSLSGGTGSFVNKNTGSSKTVNATGLTLTGAAAGNYALASTTATTAADITTKPITVTA